MAGYWIRCTAKYLLDNGFLSSDVISVETASGIKKLKVYTSGGKVTLVSVNMGKADFSAKALPSAIDADEIVDYPVKIAGQHYNITCVNVGNPHCVVFCDNVETADVEAIGPQFENSEMFPERINTEFVQVVDATHLKMRVWERGSGATLACGTGACAVAAAAVLTGRCPRGAPILVQLPGGTLEVCVQRDDTVLLTGDAAATFSGTVLIQPCKPPRGVV